MAESVWTRQYLKSMGAKDDEIDYQNGAVTYKNKPFQYTTPKADGKAYGSQQDLSSAYKAYQSNEALDQYKNNINKPITPFSYDMNSIKADPLYTSALNSYTQDANRGTNTALSNLGRRGIGNSQSAVTAELSGQQDINDYANNKLAPQVVGQKYQQYLDQMSQQDKQNQSLLGLSGVYDQQNQQSFNNNISTNQERRLDDDTKFNQGITAAGVTGYYDQYVNQKKQMQDNSAAWFNATPAERDRLAAQNKEIGASIGATQDAQGNWIYPKAQQTLVNQGQTFNQKMDTDKFNYDKEQSALQNTAQYVGIYNGMPTMQKIMQDASIANMTKDNARSAAAEARAAGNQQLGALFDIWDRTGVAPAGITGVPQGTRLAGKDSTPKQMSTQDAISLLSKSPFVTEETIMNKLNEPIKTGKINVDKPGMIQSIVGLGLPDDQLDALFSYYGISQKEIQAFEKQLSGN